MVKEKIKCPCCHKGFTPRRANQFYCKESCTDRARKIRLRYNITPAAVYAIYKAQSGRCAICDVKGDIHELGFTSKAPFHIDHDHSSGRVRGLLCPECNKGLGMFKDSRLFLEQAIKYLTHHSGGREDEINEEDEN